MNGDEYLERVRTLIPAFRERAALTERTRRLPDASWRTFSALGCCARCSPRDGAASSYLRPRSIAR
jgi:hypothetical protein